MLKRNFIFLVLFAGCSTSNEIEQKVLISSVDEPKGANCINGGIKIISGKDLNGNTQLEMGEITATHFVCLPDVPLEYEGSIINVNQIPPYSLCPNGGIQVVFSFGLTDISHQGQYQPVYIHTFCHDKEAIYQIEQSIKLPDVYMTSDTLISEASYLQSFNFDDFESYNYIDYTINVPTDFSGLSGIVQLYDITDNETVFGTGVPFAEGGHYSSSFMESHKAKFPHKKIKLGVRAIATVKNIWINVGFLSFKKDSLK